MVYVVRVNKYSHEGSSFDREDSRHETLQAAIAKATKVIKYQRFAYVVKEGSKDILFEALKPEAKKKKLATYKGLENLFKL